MSGAIARRDPSAGDHLDPGCFEQPGVEHLSVEQDGPTGDQRAEDLEATRPQRSAENGVEVAVIGWCVRAERARRPTSNL